ncbi:MAG: DNA cytosine methyltransferase [archaeon]|nr:MAG: DNA cytosine methyltransferase [archaeon]
MAWKVMDLFCGTGGFSHGLCEGLGDESKVVFGIDILKHAVATFRANNAQAIAVCADITKFPPRRVQADFGISRGDIDVIAGGPPCQGFTSIRPHRSRNNDDLRNSLYVDFLDYVDYFRPKAFIMENVIGLATYNHGRTIRAVMDRAKGTGYSVDWRIFNAANFGVPQRRERLLMVGFRDVPRFSFPRPTHKSNGSTIGYYDKSKVISVTPEIDNARELAEALTAWDAISDLPEVEPGREVRAYSKAPLNEYQKRLRGGCNELALHYATSHGRRMLDIVKRSGPNVNSLPKGIVKSGFSTSYSRIEPDKPSVTLTGNFPYPGSNKCIHPFQDRAITPREAARIQSFPDNFVFIGNKSQIAKLIGNAVPPLLGNVMGKWCRRYLDGTAVDLGPIYQTAG